MNLPLYKVAPGIEAAFPCLGISELPTPLERHEIAGQEVWIKRDDKTARGYGGNKVRKLDFLLADARKQQRRSVLTFGFAGSNFAAATAWYAKQQGLSSISLLLPQSPEPYVQKNLLLQLASGAKLIQKNTVPFLGLSAIGQMLLSRLRDGRWPYWIPAGGSSPVGVLGFVNAALELNEQLKQSKTPVPTHIYLAMGSMGSVAGLAIGATLCDLPIRLVAARVVEQRFANKKALRKLVQETLQLLRQCQVEPPTVEAVMARIEIRDDAFGQGYGVPSAVSKQATEIAEIQGLPVDPAYTAKALGCLIQDMRARDVSENNFVPLFWLTCNANSIDELIDPANWQSLPKAFHRYFNSPPQWGRLVGPTSGVD